MCGEEGEGELCVCVVVCVVSTPLLSKKYGGAGQHGQVESLTGVTHLLNDDGGVFS